MNDRPRESDAVGDVFIQPVADDAGLPIGAGMLERSPTENPDFTTVQYGLEYGVDEIKVVLETNKIPYSEPNSVEPYLAERLSDGALVGWFNGRIELGPRVLGH